MRPSLLPSRAVALSMLSQTAVAVAVGLPVTIALTLWRFGGDLSQSLTGWEFLKFGLWVTTFEILAICPALTFRGAAAIRSISNLRDRLYALASHDPLTGLLNRRGFDEAVAGLAKTGRMAVAVCDIDHFKRVNDRFGHDAGDQVLKEVARQLIATTEDWEEALLARFGGEEFVVAFPGGRLEEAHSWAERARVRIAARSTAGPEGPIAATASFGVAAAPFDGDLAALLARADQALYLAKDSGRNRVAAFEARLSPAAA